MGMIGGKAGKSHYFEGVSLLFFVFPSLWGLGSSEESDIFWIKERSRMGNPEKWSEARAKEVVCPHCGMSTCGRWALCGDDLFGDERRWVCTFCGKELPGAPSVQGGVSAGVSERKSDDLLLDDLFGDGQRASCGAVLQEGVSSFCRNCMHYLSGPFLSRCHLHHRDTEPMDGCVDFMRKRP